jgi:NYN domain/OST-HTH/LOTUS domain
MATTDIATTAKLALLIDGDNVSAALMPLIMREATKHGAVAVRRIYGQFQSGRMKSWQKLVDEFDLTTVNVAPLTHGKNATDMKLVIEAMDMLHGRQLDGICIASSDGDFMPLAARIRANALAVYGFGAKKAPSAYKAAFDKFFECDTLFAAEKKAPARKASPPARKPANAAPASKTPKPATTRQAATELPDDVRDKILEAIDRVQKSDGQSHMRSVGNAITKALPGFKAKDYGFGTTAALIRALPGVEITKQRNDSFVRRKQT